METILIILAPVFLVSAFFACRGIATGDVKFGYKYYGKGVSANRWKDPFSFWMGIILYGIIALVSISIIIVSIARMT